MRTANDYWIVGATIVDGTGRDPITGKAVEVVDGRITTIGDAPAGASTLDATGLTLTPGLIDAHVHLGFASEVNASLRHELSVAEMAADIFANCGQTLDAGFTTVRDTGGLDGGVVQTVAKGKVRGPRIISCGPIVCQTGGHGHFSAEWEPTEMWDHHSIPGLRTLAALADGPEEMRKVIRETFRRGAKFIKMCVTGGVISSHDNVTDTQFAVEEIAVAVQEASARGSYVTVHAHTNAGVRNAVRAGVKCIEHGSELDEETAALMAAHGVAHVPTLAVMEALLDDAAGAGLPSWIVDRVKLVRQGQIDGVLASRAAGVKIGSGSDLIGPNQRGRGMELTLRAGLETPMAALRSATQANAEILGIADQVGTIEVGKVADLVAWAGDPLESAKVFSDADLAHVVVQAGRVVKDLR